ncbi:MAG: cytochrome c-type biogenesis protein [Rhabdaerophilum sp.]
MRRPFGLLLALALSATPALAVRPGEQLPDAAQENRARKLSAELRCLVCQNQSIDDSDAPLAVDLRRIVRERIRAGDSDTAIRDFLVARYGAFVLLKPPVSGQTILLWSLPGLALVVGGLAAWRLFRRRPEEGTASPEDSLSPEERAELQALLERPGRGGPAS